MSLDPRISFRRPTWQGTGLDRPSWRNSRWVVAWSDGNLHATLGTAVKTAGGWRGVDPAGEETDERRYRATVAADLLALWEAGPGPELRRRTQS